MDWKELEKIEDQLSEYELYESFEGSNLSFDDILRFKMDRFFSDPKTIEVMQNSFVDKVSDIKYSIIKNEKTGEYCFPMVPFRGNPAHSKKKFTKIQPIVESFKEREFSKPMKIGRPTEIRQVHAILITLSYTRDYSKEETTKQGYPIKKWRAYDAWESITDLVNQFKVELSRIVKEKHIGIKEGNSKDSAYASCLVKEGSRDMYPAPHLIVIVDKPLIAHRYGKQWLLGRRGDRGLVDSIQAIWERLAGSHCKINAIVSAGGFAYVFKYVMKSVSLDVKNIDQMTKEQKVCLNTHLNQSLHNQHDIIGKKFLEKLEYVRQETLLDITRNELKQSKKELKELAQEIEEKGGFNAFTFSIYPNLRRYYSVLEEIDKLRWRVYDLKMEHSPWFYISGGFSSLESAQFYAMELE